MPVNKWSDQGITTGNIDVDKFLNECLCHDLPVNKRRPKWLENQMKFEAVLAARMLDGYNKKAKKAITRVANMAGDGRPLSAITKSLRSQMRTIFNKNQKSRLAKDIRQFYATDRSIAANEFKIDVAKKIEAVTIKGAASILKQDDPSVGISFDIKDREIISLIESQNLIAASNFFRVGLSAHVVSVISKIIKDTGLSRTEQKKRIRSELSKAMGLKAGEVALEGITPPQFKGTSKDYYTGLAETTLTRAQGMGRLNLFKQGDFKTYRISAILDRRTSVICQSLDGRTFTVEDGERHLNNVLAARSTEELKKVAGWRRNLTEFGVPLDNPDKFKTGPGSAAFSKSLAEAGLALPPYHFRCRTTIRPV